MVTKKSYAPTLKLRNYREREQTTYEPPNIREYFSNNLGVSILYKYNQGNQKNSQSSEEAVRDQIDNALEQFLNPGNEIPGKEQEQLSQVNISLERRLRNSKDSYYDKTNNKYLPIDKTLKFPGTSQQPPTLDSEIASDGGVDQKSGAKVFYVDPSFFPHIPGGRVYGMYDPNTHTIYVANDLSNDKFRYVYHHEVGHALKRGGTEAEADAHALREVGYDPIRRTA